MAELGSDLGRYERRLREQGFGAIAGADEAGRGALAGPLVAAAVILPETFDIEGLADSKMLTRLQREACYERIVEGALAWVACRAMPTRIDRRGLHRSNGRRRLLPPRRARTRNRIGLGPKWSRK